MRVNKRAAARRVADRLSDFTHSRFFIEHDTDAQFEECNGEHRPLTEAEYADNQYFKDGRPVLYADYLTYYGNPDRHVYLYMLRQDRCPCCDSWRDGGSVFRIDFMDDQLESQFRGKYTYSELTGYLVEVARELDPADFKGRRKP